MILIGWLILIGLLIKSLLIDKQEIQPVQEEILTIVAKGEQRQSSAGGAGASFSGGSSSFGGGASGGKSSGGYGGGSSGSFGSKSGSKGGY